MNLSTFEENLKTLETNVIIAKQNEAILKKDIATLQGKISATETMNEELEKVIVILTQAATTSRDNARAHFEKIITDALQFVSQSSDYEFVIKELTGRAKASYEFYIKSTVNGVECIQKPEDANGGGFVDIISVAAKYAYLEIFNDPKIMSGTLLYDEPGKMISEQMSVKFAEYIKFLGNHYGRQTIMVTHNDNLSNVADKTFVVRKDRNGISTATEMSAMNISFDDVEGVLNEDTN
jgi:DNA repair ATPase RecN